MKRFLAKYYPEITGVIVAAINWALVNTVAAPCPSGMICKRTTLIASIAFTMISLMSVLMAVLRKVSDDSLSLRTVCRSVVVICSGMVYSIISFLGGCKIETMACRVKTFPTLYTEAAILMAVFTSAIVADYCFSKKTNRR